MSHSRKKASRYWSSNDSFFKRLVHTRNRMLARCGIYLESNQYKRTVDDYDICDTLWIEWDKDSDWYEKGLRK